MLDSYLSALCQYAVRTGLIQTDDVVCCRNALLEALALDSFTRLPRLRRRRLPSFCRL